MDRPTVGQVAEVLYEDLGAQTLGDEAVDWHLLTYCGAIGAMFEDLWTVVQDDGDTLGWEKSLDPDEAPAFVLDWLGQFVGVQRRPEWSDDDMRAAIKANAHTRGTVESIVSTAQMYLTGSKRVRIIERFGDDPYVIWVRTIDTETPDPTVVAARLREDAVPARLVLDYATVSGQLYEDLDGQSYDDLAGTYDTYDDAHTG